MEWNLLKQNVTSDPDKSRRQYPKTATRIKKIELTGLKILNAIK
jgi:hypothetical protein